MTAVQFLKTQYHQKAMHAVLAPAESRLYRLNSRSLSFRFGAQGYTFDLDVAQQMPSIVFAFAGQGHGHDLVGAQQMPSLVSTVNVVNSGGPMSG